MKITVLDANTLGKDLDLSRLSSVGDVTVYDITEPCNVEERIKDTDVVVLNKIKLNETNLAGAKNLKLICVTATGYDNIDVAYCNTRNIQVSNIVGYSTNSVAQVTVATVLELATHIREYNRYVTSGNYTNNGVANRVSPVFHELSGKTWGIIGLGNIGKKVANIAKAFGCRVIAFKRTPDTEYECCDLETLCKNSDIISIHTPLNESTRNMISKKELDMMKPSVIIYNAARGAVTDENAVADAILAGKVGAFGCDVYSIEPFPSSHPMQKIAKLDNVCLTPHMAWASFEARNLCIDEVILNIESFKNGIKRNSVN
ncbi:MAG: hydroxyacid dehydrogenase [Clostridia bacterium]|nr:hydroxyacid dehydrogenase [Clostridia bacterium]